MNLETQENGSTTALIKWAAFNSGSRSAENALILLYVARTVKIQRCNSAGSNLKTINPILQDHVVSVNGDPVASHSCNEDVDLRPNIQVNRHALLTFESPGTYEIGVLIHHADIEGGTARVSETVLVPRVASRGKAAPATG